MAPRAYRASRGRGPLRQAEILSSIAVPFFRHSSLLSGRRAIVDLQEHDWAIILSQDCDLDWDYASRFPRGTTPPKNKELPSVLLCEARLVHDGVRLPQFDRDIWRRVSQNQDERYHVLDAVPADADQLGQGFAQLLIDFKRYFTVETGEIYQRLRLGAANASKVLRRSELESPYREDLSQRFATYQSRIALPANYGRRGTPPTGS